MKQLQSITAFLLLIIASSCGSSNTDASTGTKQEQLDTIHKDASQLLTNIAFDTATLLKDFATWYDYTYKNIRLAQDFIGLHADSTVLQKAQFLDQLQTGLYIPIKTQVQANLPVYRLFRLKPNTKDIQLTMQQMATTAKEHFNMEGKPLPNFDFKDLNGRQYNAATTKGKTLLLKCWFINCVACVQEFPHLNGLVSQYKGKTDLLFVSLAMDDQQALSAFLLRKPFSYAVVPNQEAFMSAQLGITAYPTHLLVDKNGKIVKVTNSIDDMLPFLEKEVEKKTL